jgi:hypothetical protein
MTLADILQIQQVRAETQQREQSVPGLLTSDQLAQVAAIETLLAEIGEPTLDEQLEATIVSLTKIRDRL